MKLTMGEIISIVLVIISWIIGLYFYPQFPEQVASHWGANGEVNGYMSKFWGTFLMPIISIVMLVIFMIVPRVDPKKTNIEKFRKYFDGFIVLLFIFLIYLYCLTIAWNLGQKFNMVQWLIPAFAVLFYCAGVLISKSEPNWTIGIRTPWTLSSETVWKKTHEVMAKFFKAAALIGLIGIFIPNYGLWLVLAPVIIVVIFSFVYSYILYRREQYQK